MGVQSLFTWSQHHHKSRYDIIHSQEAKKSGAGRSFSRSIMKNCLSTFQNQFRISNRLPRFGGKVISIGSSHRRSRYGSLSEVDVPSRPDNSAKSGSTPSGPAWSLPPGAHPLLQLKKMGSSLLSIRNGCVSKSKWRSPS
jgi:hypothetical protein